MELPWVYLGSLCAISGIFAIYYQLCLMHNTRHQMNRVVLLSSLALSILIPLIQIRIPIETPYKIKAFTERAVIDAGSSEEWENELTSPNQILNTSSSSAIFQTAAFLIFMVVSLLFIGRLLVSLRHLFKKIKQQNAIAQGNLKLYFDDSTEQPFSFFHHVFIPENLRNYTELMHLILRHEGTHAKRFHSVDLLFIQLLETFLWWNPFFHLLKKQLILTHEYEADAATVLQTDPRIYAGMLLKHIFPGLPVSSTHSFYQSPLKSRIMMLLHPRKQATRQWILLPVLGLIVLIFSTSFQKSGSVAGNAPSLKVVVDAGHGGMDGGATLAGLKEKDFTLALAKALQEKVKGSGITILLTREQDELPVKDNISESLHKRVDLVEKSGADVLISLHVNSTNNPKEKSNSGILVYVAGTNNEMATQSRPLANALLQSLSGGPLTVDPNIQQRNQQTVYVLDKCPKPAVLLEVGYMTNQHDVDILSDKKNIHLIAEGILQGLQHYAAIK